MSKIFIIASLMLLPMAAAVGGYLVLTSHLQGVEAVIYGWVLFIGGFASMPVIGAVAVELTATDHR